DWSASGIKRTVAWLHAQEKRLRGWDTATLDDRQRFERQRLLADIDANLFWMETVEWPFRNPKFYGLEPSIYVTRAYAPLPERLRAYTKYARAVPRAAAEIRKNLRTPLPRTYVKFGRLSFGGLASYYEKDVPGVFASVADAK